MQPVYIIISLVVLAVVAILAIYKWRLRQPQRLSKLAGLAFVFIMAGLIFGDNRLVGYSFLGLGVLFAVIDIVKNLKSR